MSDSPRRPGPGPDRGSGGPVGAAPDRRTPPSGGPGGGRTGAAARVRAVRARGSRKPAAPPARRAPLAGAAVL